MSGSFVRLVVDIAGVVQGVGFRPSLQRLALEDGLGGWVQNRSGTVRLALEGERDVVRRFMKTLSGRLPAQARVDDIVAVSDDAIATEDVTPFRIVESEADEGFRVSIPADLRMCADCRREVFAPASRFHGYPFTTCTNCGPRYTVVDGVPYDRERTALREFPLCPACLAEYEDPFDRRFHAESIACPTCGPRLQWLDGSGERQSERGEALRAARAAIHDGGTVAVRGLGGFLLAVDALDAAGVERLRERKHRPDKPFAVMARDVDVIRRFCVLGDEQLAQLRSSEGPIVILDLLASAEEEGLPACCLTPDSDTLGVMLPTTPLHELLFRPLDGDPTPAFDLLVMTSGNRGGEPICIRNDEALERLTGIADGYLVHDREILLRNDDSLVAPVAGGLQVWRRARGWAPQPVRLKRPVGRDVLAMGAELKNAIALAFGAEAVLSPHIGDLATPEALDGLELVAERFPEYFRRTPEVVAVDLHPDMHATRLGLRLAEFHGARVVRVQHHHAHGAAAMAEHGLEESLAVVFDGTGLGDDGRVWGAELLHIGAEGQGIAGYRRLATFAPVRLPGGDAAVRQPVRQLVARWATAGVEPAAEWADRLGAGEEELAVWRLQCARGLNAPETHAAGRLFDAFSAAVGAAPAHITWEGQAAIRLEREARRWQKDGGDTSPDLTLPWTETLAEAGDLLTLDWAPTFARLAERPPEEDEQGLLAWAFHRAVADAVLRMVAHGAAVSGVTQVVLSGGVFMNRVLNEMVVRGLADSEYQVYLHRSVPPNDGGVALGQAVVAGHATDDIPGPAPRR